MFYLILSNDVRFIGLGVSWGWCSRDNRSHLMIYPLNCTYRLGPDANPERKPLSERPTKLPRE